MNSIDVQIHREIIIFGTTETPSRASRASPPVHSGCVICVRANQLRFLTLVLQAAIFISALQQHTEAYTQAIKEAGGGVMRETISISINREE